MPGFFLPEFSPFLAKAVGHCGRRLKRSPAAPKANRTNGAAWNNAGGAEGRIGEEEEGERYNKCEGGRVCPSMHKAHYKAG